jgi:hypothetical protein
MYFILICSPKVGVSDRSKCARIRVDLALLDSDPDFATLKLYKLVIYADSHAQLFNNSFVQYRKHRYLPM